MRARVFVCAFPVSYPFASCVHLWVLLTLDRSAVTYRVTFTGLNCDHNLPLMHVLSSLQPSEEAPHLPASANVTRVQPASQPLSGDVLVSFQGSQWASIPAGASARTFAAALSALGTGASSQSHCNFPLCLLADFGYAILSRMTSC